MTDQQDASHRLGKYEVLEEIGKGGFATVYRALDTVLGREVALKVLAPQLLHDQTWVARFFKEARAAAGLEHPHIATIYDIESEEGQVFIPMQLVEGGSLADRIKEGLLPWPEALRIANQVADALDYAHEQGVLHRDLKPANILLGERRGAILTDFGLASMIGEHTLSLSQTGGVVGTPSYIAPEIWEEEPASAQSDQYALGCILYEMVTGDKAFPGKSPPAVMRAHFKPPALSKTWPPGVQRGAEAVLRKALAPRPAARYETASAFAAALAQSDQETPAEGAIRRIPGWAWAIVGGGGVLVVALAVVLLLLAAIVGPRGGGISLRPPTDTPAPTATSVAIAAAAPTGEAITALSILSPTHTATPSPSPTLTGTVPPSPTSTSTRVPRPTATRKPAPTGTLTPTLDVIGAPSVSACPTPTYFPTVWESHQEIGCPIGSSTSDFTFQPFENGLLIWRKSPSPSTVYALYYADRRWERQTDPGGPPVPSCPEAEAIGGMGPILSFGTLWCQPWNWKETLGWPLDTEKDAKNNRIEDFENGSVLTVGAAGGFILYSDSNWESF